MMSNALLDKHFEKLLFGVVALLFGAWLYRQATAPGADDLPQVPERDAYYTGMETGEVPLGKYRQEHAGEYWSGTGQAFAVREVTESGVESVPERVFTGIDLDLPVPGIEEKPSPLPDTGSLGRQPVRLANGKVPFMAREYDTVIRTNGRPERGTIISERNEWPIRLEDVRGTLVMTLRRDEVRKVLYAMDVEEAFEAALDEARKQGNYLQLLEIANYCRRQEMSKRGLEALEAAQRLDPGRPDAWLLAADLRMDEGNYIAAQQALAKCPKSSSAEVVRRQAMILLRRGDGGKAREMLEPVVARHPDRPELRLLMGEALLAGYDHDGAYEAFQKALQLDPDNLPAALGMARVMLTRGDVTQAEVMMQSANRFRGSKEEENLAGVIDAIIDYHQGEYEEAERRLRQVLLDSGMENARAYLTRGLIQIAQEQLDEAETSLRYAIEKEPSLGRAHGALGYVLEQKGDPQALAAYQRAAEASPTDAYLHYALGLAQVEREDWAAAEKSLREAVRRNPKDVKASHALSIALLQQKRYGDVLSHWNQAKLVLGDGHVEMQIGIGLANLGLEHWQAAGDALRQALTLEPEKVSALLGLAYLANYQRQEALALDYCLQALSNDGDNTWALQALQGLYEDRDEELVYFSFSGETIPRSLVILGRGLGIDANAVDGKVVFSGNMRGNRGSNVRMYYDVAPVEFLRVEADIEVPQQDSTEVGISLVLERTGEVRIGRNADGKLYYQLRGRVPQSPVILDDWPEGTRRLSISTPEPGSGRFELRGGKGVRRSVSLEEMKLQGKLTAGVFVTTDYGNDVKIAIDNLLLTRRAHK